MNAPVKPVIAPPFKRVVVRRSALGKPFTSSLLARLPEGFKVEDQVLLIGEDFSTSVPGIFAGGDIVRGPALVVNADQDGKVTARAIKEYLASV